jgi:hypothetical protein
MKRKRIEKPDDKTFEQQISEFESLKPYEQKDKWGYFCIKMKKKYGDACFQKYAESWMAKMDKFESDYRCKQKAALVSTFCPIPKTRWETNELYDFQSLTQKSKYLLNFEFLLLFGHPDPTTLIWLAWRFDITSYLHIIPAEIVTQIMNYVHHWYILQLDASLQTTLKKPSDNPWNALDYALENVGRNLTEEDVEKEFNQKEIFITTLKKGFKFVTVTEEELELDQTVKKSLEQFIADATYLHALPRSSNIGTKVQVIQDWKTWCPKGIKYAAGSNFFKHDSDIFNQAHWLPCIAVLELQHDVEDVKFELDGRLDLQYLSYNFSTIWLTLKKITFEMIGSYELDVKKRPVMWIQIQIE